MLVGKDARVPGSHDMPTAIRIGLDDVDDLLNLVDAFVVPVSPLSSVNRSEVAVGISPFVPDCHLMVVEILDVGVAADEPQELIDYRLDVSLLSCDEREAFGEVKPHLMPENADCSGAGAVAFLNALVENPLK